MRLYGVYRYNILLHFSPSKMRGGVHHKTFSHIIGEGCTYLARFAAKKKSGNETMPQSLHGVTPFLSPPKRGGGRDAKKRGRKRR